MAIINGIELVEQLKTHLEANLVYIDTVEARIWEESPLPDFDKYAIILSPYAPRFNLEFNKMMQETFHLDIILVVKNFDPYKSVFGTSELEKGIIQMIYDVFVSFLDFLKSLNSLRIIASPVGVKLAGQPPIGLFNMGGGRVARHL